MKTFKEIILESLETGLGEIVTSSPKISLLDLHLKSYDNEIKLTDDPISHISVKFNKRHKGVQDHGYVFNSLESSNLAKSSKLAHFRYLDNLNSSITKNGHPPFKVTKVAVLPLSKYKDVIIHLSNGKENLGYHVKTYRMDNSRKFYTEDGEAHEFNSRFLDKFPKIAAPQDYSDPELERRELHLTKLDDKYPHRTKSIPVMQDFYNKATKHLNNDQSFGSKGHQILRGLANNKHLPDDLINKILDHTKPNSYTHSRLSSHPNSSLQTLKKLHHITHISDDSLGYDSNNTISRIKSHPNWKD